MKSDVVLHRSPDVTAARPEPPRGAYVSVQAEPDLFRLFAAEKSDLVIVLDCSGSMRAGPDNKLAAKPNRRLDRVLGDVDVAEDADQGGDCAAVLLAEDLLDHRRRRRVRPSRSGHGLR